MPVNGETTVYDIIANLMVKKGVYVLSNLLLTNTYGILSIV